MCGTCERNSCTFPATEGSEQSFPPPYSFYLKCAPPCEVLQNFTALTPSQTGRIFNMVSGYIATFENSCDMTKGRSLASQFPKHAQIGNPLLTYADSIRKRNLLFPSTDILVLNKRTKLLWILSVLSVKFLSRINQLSGASVSYKAILDYILPWNQVVFSYFSSLIFLFHKACS